MTIIIIMMAVTYIPRVAPFYLLSSDSIPPMVRRFLSFIPYAALGALLMPGSLYAVNSRPDISAAAIIFAGLLAWFNRNIITTVFLTVVAVWIMLLLF